MSEKDNEKRYFYPKFVPNQQVLQGLFFHEWLIVVAPAGLGLIFAQILGVIIGGIIGSILYMLFVRREGRRINLAHELSCAINFYTQQQSFRKIARSEIKGSGEFVDDETVESSNSEDSTENEEQDTKKSKKKKKNKKEDKKKVNKKSQKKKEQNMEDLYPFKSINDGYIEMENDSLFCYFRIQGNNLNLLSISDLHKIIDVFSKNLDTNKYMLSFFIQDSIYKVQENLDEIERCKKKVKVPFLRLLLDQTKDMIDETKTDVNKKAYFLRVKIPAKKLNVMPVEKVQERVMSAFKDSLNLIVSTREELKQMLAIYGSRIFSETLPDTELKIEQKEEKALMRKKKKKYINTQLPGIYNFKNMIVPINSSFGPSSARIGNNIVKTFAISSFLGSAKDTNLLSKVSTLKGVTVMIYLTELKLSRYRGNMKLETKAKRSTISDEVDLIDVVDDVQQLQGTYKRVKDENQKMYYVSVYVQITSRTKKDLELLEDKVMQELGDVNINVDGLQAQQKSGYLTTSPIGNDLLSDFTKQNVPSESVANLYPFNEPSLLDPKGLPIGNIVGSKLMALFDPFEYRGENYNMLALGSSGSGKTVLMMLIQQICVLKGYYVRNIDFEGVYTKFYNRIGGINIDVSGGNDFCINPLQVRIPDEIRKTILDDYISEVMNLMTIYKPNWNNDDLDLFQGILTKTYERFNITNDSDFSTLESNDFPIFSDVVETIILEKKNAGKEDSIAPLTMYQKLERGLMATINGADACMLNRHTNLGDLDFNERQCINLDMSQIMSSNKPRKLAQLVNVFTYITQFVNSNMDGSKRIVVPVDEIDQILSMEYLPIVEIFNNYERRFRKRMASFIKMGQTIDEFNNEQKELESKIKPLLSQPTIKFLFHLGDTDYEKPKKLLNLTDTEINKLKEKRNGKCLMKINSSIYDLEVFLPEWFADVKADMKKKGSSDD